MINVFSKQLKRLLKRDPHLTPEDAKARYVIL